MRQARLPPNMEIPTNSTDSDVQFNRILDTANVQSAAPDKQLRQKMLAKQRQQKSRIKTGLVKAGHVHEDLIRQVLEKTIESCQLQNLTSTLSKSLANSVQNWCADAGRAQQVGATLHSVSRIQTKPQGVGTNFPVQNNRKATQIVE